MTMSKTVAVAALLAAGVPPARGLPVHRLDERNAGGTTVAEAGDRIVVRLHEGGGGRWRPVAAPAAPLVAVADPTAAAVTGGYRSFAYQLRGAGEAELVFTRPGSATPLRFRILSR